MNIIYIGKMCCQWATALLLQPPCSLAGLFIVLKLLEANSLRVLGVGIGLRGIWWMRCREINSSLRPELVLLADGDVLPIPLRGQWIHPTNWLSGIIIGTASKMKY